MCSSDLCLTQVELFEISARLKLVSVPFSSLVLDIGHLVKRLKWHWFETSRSQFTE